MLERTPSMSALNEMVYSQHYQHSDASSFIFVLKVGRFPELPADVPVYTAVSGIMQIGCTGPGHTTIFLRVTTELPCSGIQ